MLYLRKSGSTLVAAVAVVFFSLVFVVVFCFDIVFLFLLAEEAETFLAVLLLAVLVAHGDAAGVPGAG